MRMQRVTGDVREPAVVPQYWTVRMSVNALSRCGVASWTGERAEEALEIRGRPLGERGDRFAARRRQRLENARDERRLVAPAAVRHGREVRAVRLDEEPVRGHESRRVAQRFGLRERDDPGERHQEADVDGAPRHLRVAGEAVEHAAKAPPTGALEE